MEIKLRQKRNHFMGQLPSVRLKPERAFKSTGVDFTGFIKIRFSPGRGSKSYKGYICIFICIVTHSMHLEAVSSLTTEGLIAAFRRFVSRRGYCKDLYSDNGTNFVGPDKELRDMYNKAKSDFPKELSALLANEGTMWHYIPLVMGACWCKDIAPEDTYEQPTRPTTATTATDFRINVPRVVDAAIVDQLVLELLTLIASFVDNDEESPVSLVKLHMIADKEEGWFQVVSSLVHVIPLEDPLGPSAITIVFDDCPLPSKESVIKLSQLFGLSLLRAETGDLNVRVERNICVVLGCIADKLAGPNSIAVLTNDTLDYMLTFLIMRREPCVVLFALIALEKFAHTTENKLTIKKRMEKEVKNPLLLLEKLARTDDYEWRQVGFCAKWALDNLFIIEGRKLSYETVNMSHINAILNSHDVSEYLKISCDGLEARCDSYSFESVRCTFQINSGCWYYECLIVTPGVMQIGWATKSSHFLNHEGYGIGDDLYSLSYDGCRKLIWHEAKPTAVTEVPAWRAGDVVGCLIDMDAGEAIFSLNGHRLTPCTELFQTTKQGFFAAASFMAFQQCRFNFGSEAFHHPPYDRDFRAFNDFGYLTDEEKQVVPRRIYLEQLRCSSLGEDSCTLCYDDKAAFVLEPCLHRGFCSLCTAQLKECPMCRATIMNVRREET